MKPVTVEAVRWTGDNLDEVYELTGCENFDVLDEQDRANCDDPEATATVFGKLHSTWTLVYTGQWVIKGIRGEFFRLADDLFREAYEAEQEPQQGQAADWTADPETGRSNASPVFRGLVEDVDRLLRGGAGGMVLRESWTSGTAALIVAQLAHVHQLAPAGPQPGPDLAAAVQAARDAERERIRQLAIDYHAMTVSQTERMMPFEEMLRRSPEENAAALLTVVSGAGETPAGRPATDLENAMLRNVDGLNGLVRDMLQSFPDTADEQEWRDRAGALDVRDPDGQPYAACTEADL
jgi:hypothetical protein